MVSDPLQWDAESSSGLCEAQLTSSLGPLDVAGMVAGFVLTIVATCVLSRGRIFWEDELLGWLLLSDPSWHHMLAAWKLGADGDGLAFLLTGRAWFHLFGISELSFRLYSSTCFGLAFVVIWIAGRRFYNGAIVGVALFYIYFFSPTIVMHMTEGRFYGLELLSAALVVWLAFITTSMPGRVPGYLYFATFAVHVLLTTSHILGVVYSGVILAAIVAIDFRKGRPRPLLYVSAMASWLVLFLERTAIIASAQVGKPHFWTTQPRGREVVRAISSGSDNIACMLFVLTLAVAVTHWYLPKRVSRASSPVDLNTGIKNRLAVYVVALALLSVPIAFYVYGTFGTPLMISRYLMPATIALFFWVAEGLYLIFEVSPLKSLFKVNRSSRLVRLTLVLCFAVLILSRVFRHFVDISASPRNYTQALAQRLPKGIPVVCDDAFTFTEMLAGRHIPDINCVFLLDWEHSIQSTAPHGEVTEYHLMENWKKAGYFSDSIEYLDPFLRRHEEFLVIDIESPKSSEDAPGLGNPIAQRLSSTSQYEVKEFAEVNAERISAKPVLYRVWQICRGKCNIKGALQSP